MWLVVSPIWCWLGLWLLLHRLVVEVGMEVAGETVAVEEFEVDIDVVAGKIVQISKCRSQLLWLL